MCYRYSEQGKVVISFNLYISKELDLFVG
ncbi:hypothetical protein PLUA15_190056 [Pseudomonas lundensis]|uniref:Uncharacterized protein n=1 Tax=Pseudomonas lundensis TaxID=86185 RepID=A0AAX2H590_9PSED|nr:hypothetical protein PLUA15_190056 [Pseudomonas lundensis]